MNATRRYRLRPRNPLPGTPGNPAPLAPGAKGDDDIDAIIARNLGSQRERHGFAPTAGPDDPIELAEYLDARRTWIAADGECYGDAEETLARFDRLSHAARMLVVRISATPGGRLDAQGYRYTIGDRGGIQVEQL